MSEAISFQIRELTKSYRMGDVTIQALRGVTLDVYQGELVVLLGPSGSGKSTLLNILGALDTPTSGKVFYRGQQMTASTEQELTLFRREHIGFVFQFYNLIANLTALENVEMVTEIAPQPMQASEALSLLGLQHRMHHFPTQLSGGEQQRVAIARAIAKRPEVLLCDEPTGALDCDTGRIVLDSLLLANKQLNTTVVIITHNIVIADIADRVIHIADGVIADIKVNQSKRKPSELLW